MKPFHKAIIALREPDAALSRVPNTIRQSIADIIEGQAHQIDKYGLALMMISQGCADHEGFAARILAEYPLDPSPFQPCAGCYTIGECRKADHCFAPALP